MILVVGHLGSIGSRYRAILDWYDIPYITHDIRDYGEKKIDLDDVTKMIVATPTSNHGAWALMAADKHIPVLIEKPLATTVGEAEEIARVMRDREAWVVSNYRYVFEKYDPPYKIHYDNYNTGKDGMWLDVVQLLMLDPEAKIGNKCPYLNLWCGGKMIYPREIERSYMQMILDFVKGKTSKLWTVEDGVEMVRLAYRRMEDEGLDRNPG